MKLLDVKPIQIISMTFGTIKFINIEAIEMDLANTPTIRAEDISCDGVLGKNVLRGLRFALNSQTGHIEWGVSARE